MESNRHFTYDTPGADLPYDFSSSCDELLSELLSYPMKFNLGNSPNSPLSNRVDCDTFSTVSNSQEQHSSTEAPSGKSPSHNSSLESNSPFNCSPVNFLENLQFPSCTPASFSTQSERYALQKIETILMAPESDEATASNHANFDDTKPSQLPKSRSRPLTYELQADSSLGYRQYVSSKYQKLSHGPYPEKCPSLAMEAQKLEVRWLLVECARAISEDRLADFEILVQETEKVVSITGDPLQRLGAYMLEGLVARQEASGTRIYRSLRCRQPESSELLSNMQILYDICPYVKFGYMAANGAIAEAVRNEDHVHIIDFQIAQGTQWITLIQALAKRPSGPPHVRITGIDDEVSRYARGDGLQVVGRRLKDISKEFNLPLEFHAVSVYGSEVTREMLDIRPGEAVAVNFTLHLHHTPDESVDVNNPRDGLLRLVKGLSPKVTTLVEQESNTNTAPFLTRFTETLGYYFAMFESIDEVLPREHTDRINVEKNCLAKDIVNVIACEGKDRVERHELLGKWKSRLTMAGFKQCPLSSYVNSVIKSLLRCYSDKYTLVEKDGAMLLGWKNRNLISASAWQ